MKRFSFAIIACFSLWLAGCKQSSNTKEEKQPERKTLSLQFIDPAVKPGDNFFLYANGKWVDTAKIAPTEFRAGARLEMDYATKAAVKEVLQDAASSNAE